MSDQTACVCPTLCAVLLVLPCPGSAALRPSDEPGKQHFARRGSYSLPDVRGGEMNKPLKTLDGRPVGQCACRRG